MRTAILLVLSLCLASAFAADPPQRPLDGNQPADALQILTILAAQAPLKLDESEARRAAILTLQAVVARDAKAAEDLAAISKKLDELKASAVLAPAEPAKPKE